MEHAALKLFEEQQCKSNVPYFQPGDTVCVNTRVIEGDKERIQAFEGYVIARQGSGLGETFTVRKISSGVGVERTFPLNSTKIESITVVRRGHVRRAKLFYLRDRVGKATRIKARQKNLKDEYAKMGMSEVKTKTKQSRKKKRKAKAKAAAAASE